MKRQGEKRKFARLNILVDVAYKKQDAVKEEKLTLTKNISKGGICFIGYESLRESDIIDLQIYLPEDKNPVSAMARVVWVKEFLIGEIPKGKRYDVGVEFVQISEEDKTRIDRYILTHTV